MKNVKGGEIKIDLLKRERKREREMVMVEMETERFLRQIKQRQSGQRACVRDGDGKREIDWVFIWTNLQNKNVWIMKRGFELWKRASLFKLKKLKILKRGQNIHTKAKTCQKWYVIFTNLNKNGRGIKIDSFWKPGVFNWILVWENKREGK